MTSLATMAVKIQRGYDEFLSQLIRFQQELEALGCEGRCGTDGKTLGCDACAKQIDCQRAVDRFIISLIDIARIQFESENQCIRHLLHGVILTEPERQSMISHVEQHADMMAQICEIVLKPQPADRLLLMQELIRQWLLKHLPIQDAALLERLKMLHGGLQPDTETIASQCPCSK